MSSARTVKPGEPVTCHATERQKIDITGIQRGEPIVTQEENSDRVTKVIHALNVALDCFRRLNEVSDDNHDVSVSWCVYGDGPEEEYALRLWATAHAGEVECRESESIYDNNTRRIRSVGIYIGRHRVAWVQWPMEQIASAPVDEPAAAPRVLCDADLVWSPASGQEMP